jgi:hypothetical protein
MELQPCVFPMALRSNSTQAASGARFTPDYSRYTQPVEFPDRRGIRAAQMIAEEKGKAQIIRFFGEEISSERLVEEVDASVQSASRIAGPNSKDDLSKTTQRTMKQSVREFTRSYAQGSLRGVTVIGSGYDTETEEAWVKVGFSRATMTIADAVHDSMKHVSPGGSALPKQSSEPVKRQPSEIRTGPDIP